MSRGPGLLINQILRARQEGRLPRRFRAAGLRSACPGWAYDTRSTFRSKHRVGNPRRRDGAVFAACRWPL